MISELLPIYPVFLKQGHSRYSFGVIPVRLWKARVSVEFQQMNRGYSPSPLTVPIAGHRGLPYLDYNSHST